MAAYLKFHELERPPFEGPGSDRLVLATESLRRAFGDIKTGLDEGAPRVCISGGPGIGKSSLARALPKLLSKQARCALVRDPSRSWSQVKASIAKQLKLEAGQLSRASLLAARPDGVALVLVVDQAEHLPKESLESLDAILGYRDDEGEQLVQCVLLANLEDAARGHDVPLVWWLDQLTTRQLILAPIPPNGLRSYVDKHLAKAGAEGTRVFENEALVAIHRYTGGVPGAVSALCEQLLDRAAEQGTRKVTAALVASIFGEPPPASRHDPRREPELPGPPPNPIVEATETDAGLPKFDARPGSVRAALESSSGGLGEPEPELEVQQGLLPLDDTPSPPARDDSDFFGAVTAPHETQSRTGSLPYGGASPGSGRSARLIRNLIALAALAVLAAVLHAWWGEWLGWGQSTVTQLLEGSAEPTVTRRAPQAAQNVPEAAAEALEEELDPLMDSLRDLPREDLALEESQGETEPGDTAGLTADLRIDRGGDTNGAQPDGALSLDELYELAEKAEAETAEEEVSPWTQQGPQNPAAPAPAR